MVWRKCLAQIAVILVTLGMVGVSLFWTCRWATSGLAWMSEWLFPGGMASVSTVLAWGALYVFATIIVYSCATVVPVWLILVGFGVLTTRLGWRLPVRHRLPRMEEYY